MEGSANKAIPISAGFSLWAPHAVLRFSAARLKLHRTRWAAELLVKKPYNVVAVALANKMARIVWALMTTGRRFEATAAL